VLPWVAKPLHDQLEARDRASILAHVMCRAGAAGQERFSRHCHSEQQPHRIRRLTIRPMLTVRNGPLFWNDPISERILISFGPFGPLSPFRRFSRAVPLAVPIVAKARRMRA